MLLPPQLPVPEPACLALPTAITCSSSRRRRRPKKRKPIAFPPPPLRRLVSSSIRLLFSPRRPRPANGGWLFYGGGGWRGKAPAERAAALLLSLALGGELVGLADSWNDASGLGQALAVWAAVWRRWRTARRRRSGLRRLAAFLLGIAFCALVCHLRGAAFLNGLRETGAGRKLVRILLH